MNEKFNKLFETVKFPNGATVKNRFVMAPMVVNGSSYEGNVGEDDIKYFERRSDSASLLITGATSVTPDGNAFGYGLGLYDDNQVDDWKKLVAAMKSKGNKAIVQIYHPGYQAKFTYKDKGVVYAPSNLNLPFIPYPITAMSKEQVEETIEQFVQATRRAVEAGFDGVEIHGANHYLIQQFFSKTSNMRIDEYGGRIENRAKFALEIVKRVKKYVKENAKNDFIVGYRLSPEEIHNEDVGYLLDDSLYLINEVVRLGVDYIHTSLWGKRAYASKAVLGQCKGQSINKVIKSVIDGRALLIGAGDITSADKILEASEYVDLLALASLIIIDPDTKNKISAGKEKEITLDVENRIEDLALPKNFPPIVVAMKGNGSVPQKTIDLLRGDYQGEKINNSNF